MSYFAPRWVTELLADQQAGYLAQKRNLSELRSETAWVLLGEPGAGKSTALKHEATQVGGSCLPIADFLADDFDLDRFPVPLFLDGLDEVRAGGAEGDVARRVRAKLNSLGKPLFRLACRAADWFGTTDRDIFEGATQDGVLRVYRLEPLNEQEILTILHKNHGKPNPAAFMAMAQKNGIDGLLDNPQTLELLAKAMEGDQWPTSRQATFELACEKLAQDENRPHRDAQRVRPCSNAERLMAAGQLCAALLLADKSGIALDQTAENERYPVLESFQPPNLEQAQQAVHSRLFRSASRCDERMEASHRSVAEFLAARWLGQQINRAGLPLTRVLRLLLGRDGRTVSGLRGLYAWLALCCLSARSRLIATDPLTVLLYGDPGPMTLEDKQRLLTGLRQEAGHYSAIIWDLRSSHLLGTLADAGLSYEFKHALLAPERDDGAQAYVVCVSLILAQARPIPGLAPILRHVVEDEGRWRAARATALTAWLQQAVDSTEQIALLDAIRAGHISDPDDELAGLLLRRLFPASIPVGHLLSYLHPPKQANYTGTYLWFWQKEMPNELASTDLPVVLDQLVDSQLPFSDWQQFGLRRLLSRLLLRAVLEQGESVESRRLFAWLGIGAEAFGEVPGEREENERIAGWLEDHPEQFKGLLLHCFEMCREKVNSIGNLYACERRFRGARFPVDIGRWYLQRASNEPNIKLAQHALSQAVHTLIQQVGNQGLSMEEIEAWAQTSPFRAKSLEGVLSCDIDPYHVEEASLRKEGEQKNLALRQERTKQLIPHMAAIRTGSALPEVLHQLAEIWLHGTGENPCQRFSHYYENPQEILELAEQGFRLCPLRPDLPSVEEIISQYTTNRFHYIRLPCLVGMELHWQDGISAIEELPASILKKMLAFHLTSTQETAPWLLSCVVNKPGLLAEVLIGYVTACLRHRVEVVNGVYPLYSDPAYQPLSRLVLPELLRQVPARVGNRNLTNVEYLLKAALKQVPECLSALIDSKTTVQNMEVGQRTYWLATGLLLDPVRYEQKLWQFVESSRDGVVHLANFLSCHRIASLMELHSLSPFSIGKLIELLLPHAELEVPLGIHTSTIAMRNGDQIRALIKQLSAQASEAAQGEIERLLSLPTTSALRFSLQNARHELLLRLREGAFSFPTLGEVASVLANREPVSMEDLTALVLDQLDDLAIKIRSDSKDLFRLFWNEDSKKPKLENSCRDALIALLEPALASFGITCAEEVNRFNDKRVDVVVSFREQFKLPIEIKRDSNEHLWTALREQLQAKYAIDPKSFDHGIYLVLWFGIKGMPGHNDGGNTPKSAKELQARLEGQLSPVEKRTLFVRVLDVSWPS